MPDELELPQLMSAPAAQAIVDGRQVVYFGGTGYLGLHAHPQVIRGGCEYLQQYGVHSGTTRGNFGNPAARLVEQTAAKLTGSEAAFFFASGFLGPQILLRALQSEFDALLVDDQSHFSVQEAAAGSGMHGFQFQHRSVGDLHKKLQPLNESSLRTLVLCDGVSPISGEMAPVLEYCRALRTSPGAGILLDDAHGLGVLGTRGLGTWEQVGADVGTINCAAGEVAAPAYPASEATTWVRKFCCTTLSKAIGGYGGLIVGSSRFIANMKATCSAYLGSSAPMSAAAGASAAGLRLALGNDDLRRKLRENVVRLKVGLRDLGVPCDDSTVPIVAMAPGDSAGMRGLQSELLRREIAVGYLRNYTNLGPHGALRIAVFADHEPWMIDWLLAELRRIL